MTIRVALHHHTRYRFDRPVTLSPHEIRLRPAPHCRTPILSYSLKVAAGASTSSTGSRTRTATSSRGSSSPRRPRARDRRRPVADMTVINPFDFFVEPYAENYPFAYAPALAKELVAVPRGRRRRARCSPRGSSASARRSAPGEQHRRLPGRAEPATCSATIALPRAHGAGRADAGGDAGARPRLLPRLRLAAGADPAPPRARGALRRPAT